MGMILEKFFGLFVKYITPFFPPICNFDLITQQSQDIVD